jgi:molybdate transport system ATP-binding protein
VAWIENVSYSASGFDLNVPRWDFPDEGVSCVFGESGSGKTTLLQIMAGLIPSHYRLCVRGEILSDLPVKFRNIGFVFQDYALFPHMTVRENLAFAAQAKGLTPDIWKDHGGRLLQKLDLTTLADQKTSAISGGEQQRTALARALITKPKIVLMDEPFSALDENRRDEARDLISQLSKEFQVPFILVTHDIRDVRRLSENIILFKDGKVLGFGKSIDILNHPPTLEIAKAIPENQIIELNGSFSPKASREIPHQGVGQFLVAKNWSFRISTSPGQHLKGVVLKTIDEGPHLICSLRLSSGQIIRAMAPLNSTPKGEVDIEYDPSSLIIFKGR